MNTFLIVLLAGVAGTLAMTIFMYVCHWSKFANGDMVRAIGSIFTKKYENSFVPGLAVHFTNGILFAFIYYYAWQRLGILGAAETTDMNVMPLIGLMTGFVHGFVVSFSLVVAVAEHHPLEQFRRVGFAVALVHVLGHVVYGLVVALVLSRMLFA
ncbi:MAG: hypothetical protein AB7T49_08790 [Oligoflexales bacterium]